MALAVVEELRRSHAAEVLHYDVVDGRTEIPARVPVSVAQRLRAQTDRLETSLQRIQELR
jgi:hypothetical protein